MIIVTVKVILADDEEVNLELFGELLEIIGVKVLDKVTDGKAAVASFESLKPDVVFLDIMMPEYDGLYALENIRKIDSSANVIMITADTSEETEKMLEKLQPSAVVHKPYDMITIIHILEEKLHLKVSTK